jgi:hypothetical protein
VFQTEGHHDLLNQGTDTVDFIPYEGRPLSQTDDAKRRSFALSIGAALVLGASLFAALAPAVRTPSVGEEAVSSSDASTASMASGCATGPGAR